MKSLDRAARAERRLFRAVEQGAGCQRHFRSAETPPHTPKDFLGAAVTVAILGAILLEVTNEIARPCAAQRASRSGRGTCVGLAAVAHHAHGAVTLAVAACGALAVIAFIWYMMWGYKAGQPAAQDVQGPE